MLRAVVVDDEKLVRKGFISMFDWPSFGISIVGEAGDGRTALDLLERTEADLLFTDITMPGMSGFELIKAVRQRHPHIRSVILTCHHEFDYIQEALRLGAIDYIVKTLLEVENADEVMGRIVERIGWENMNRPSQVQEEANQPFPSSSGLLFVPLLEEDIDAELLRLPSVTRSRLIRLGKYRLAPLQGSPSSEELFKEMRGASHGRWRTIQLNGISNERLQDLQETLEAGLGGTLFYSEDEDGGISRLSYEDLIRCVRDAGPGGDRAAADWLEAGQELRWTLYNREWEEFTRGIVRHRIAPPKLRDFAHELCRIWADVLLEPRDADKLAAAAAGSSSWKDWESWLRHFSDRVRNRMIDLSLSREVMACLIRAIRFMTRNAGDKINQNDVAAHINMSRSYFSQCFARFAGQPFGEILRNIRIERAKWLLLNTASPVYEIAAAAGFEDDKYFSKLFRERVGKLPTEYRADREEIRSKRYENGAQSAGGISRMQGEFHSLLRD
ncbi:response regulator [Cohnella sp. AR92]|uniref:response regulator transcription factor n=1 Tax=Cohnella sp. AR92 TaxID=648716 RepID=UPI000F8C3E78|nr:response regulator [Cohnella sp. AR92]RUS45479.1 response regulator [Cohnella sp. AR92]